ncbi:RNB domain-containing ribonuclease [Euzebya sp.]|uniref:ribonuclease catalytic domain-containing protein n=1 Tax=Euzebya sp. TaxID=1971409 RepID=UPI003515D7EA
MQVTGRFTPHPRGFGFVEPRPTAAGTPPVVVDDDGTSHRVDSAFVPPDVARGWIADDTVTAQLVVDDKGRLNAASLALVSRQRRFVVGELQPFAGKMVLQPDARLGHGELPMPDEMSARLRHGEGKQIVATLSPAGRASCAALVAGPLPTFAPSAVRARAVVIAHGGATPDSIPGGPEAVGLPAVETNTTVLRATGRMAAGQAGLAAGLSPDEGPVPGPHAPLEDRRSEIQVTIDDDSSKDLDDALSGAWSGGADDPVLVKVHIADAAGTVGIGSPADRYARTMGATAYFTAGPNAAMLDPALSEDALSLLPGQDRRAVTVSMLIAPDGGVTGVELGLSWIRPAARLSYAAVEAYLADPGPRPLMQGAHGPNGADADALPHVTVAVMALAEAARRLGAERDARDTLEDLFSAAEFEAAVVDGKIRAVEADPHPRAQRVVERLMVAANEAVAGWASARGLALLYRGHVGFAPDRLPRLLAAAEAIGEPFAEGDAVQPRHLVALVERLQDGGRHDEAAALATVATGVVARAGYTATPSSHEAMGSGAYTHFTSPLRRYADLVVHRQLRAALAGETPPYDEAELASLAVWLDARGGAAGHAQALERNALWAVLLDRRAVSFPTPGTIVGISRNGLRIRLTVPGLTGFMSAARALGVSPKERVSLELDERELATVDGQYAIGGSIKVRLDRLDELGRPDLKPA